LLRLSFPRARHYFRWSSLGEEWA